MVTSLDTDPWKQVIKRAVILSFDGTDESKARVSALLCYLSAHGLVTTITTACTKQDPKSSVLNVRCLKSR